MKFTEEDIPLMKLIFNPETHEMGMMIGQEKSKEILSYIYNEVYGRKPNSYEGILNCCYHILSDDELCDFFWDNNIIRADFLDIDSAYSVLRYSSIAEKIWDSGLLNLDELDGSGLYFLLQDSIIAEKIWKSGKLNLSLLDKGDLEELKQKFG